MGGGGESERRRNCDTGPSFLEKKGGNYCGGNRKLPLGGMGTLHASPGERALKGVRFSISSQGYEQGGGGRAASWSGDQGIELGSKGAIRQLGDRTGGKDKEDLTDCGEGVLVRGEAWHKTNLSFVIV